MGTAYLRAQHEQLLRLSEQIVDKLDPKRVPATAREIRSDLTTLAGKIGIHLTMEDKGLYHRMRDSKNSKVRAIAAQMQGEMGSLADAFHAFNLKWHSTEDIERHPTEFVREMNQMLQSLRDRIDRENTELYPLADAEDL
jgi:hemerythrin-like domain-containing protein